MNNNFKQFIFFLIISFGAIAFFYLCYNKYYVSVNSDTFLNNNLAQDTVLLETKSNPYLVIALTSDSHQNSPIFSKLKNSIGTYKPDLLIHTGDLTDFGDLENLSLAKNDLNFINVPFIALPGDHDIAETSSTKNFDKFFSYPETLKVSGIKILFVPNFYNFTPLTDYQVSSILSNIADSQIIISSQPIFVDENNLFANKYMGSETAFENLSSQQLQNLKKYKSQRDLILEQLRMTNSKKIVISGDHHRTSTFTDPINSRVSYHILGSLSKYINLGSSRLLQTSLQSNRYSVLKIFNKPGSELDFKIEEIEIK